METKEIKSLSSLGIKPRKQAALIGPRADINKLFGREIIVHSCRIEDSVVPAKPGKERPKCMWMQIEVAGSKQVLFNSSEYILHTMMQVKPEDYPVRTTVIKGDNNSHHFVF